MTDREILDEVYNRLLNNRMTDWDEADPNEEFRALVSFIEMEWQAGDDDKVAAISGSKSTESMELLKEALEVAASVEGNQEENKQQSSRHVVYT